MAEPELSPQAEVPDRRPSAERKRPALALLLSLLVHALLLSLALGGQGVGVPGLAFPWQERRAEAPELRVRLVPPRVAAEQSAPQARIEPPVAEAPTLMAPTPPVAPVTPVPTALPPVASTSPVAAPTTAAPPVVPPRAEVPVDAAPPPAPEPVAAAVAVTRSEEAKWAVPTAPVVPTPAIAAASSASSPQAEKALLQEAGAQAELERVRREAQREAQQQAEKLEAARLEAERQAAIRQEATRQEAARQETARQEAARQEIARQETARQEAARQEAARQEAARQEAARQDAARREAARVEAARLEAAQAVEAREARLRAIGRQLDEEAARRDAATAAARQSPTVSSARRGRLFGRSDANAELVQYAETWSRKIQLNMTFDMVREAARQPHTDPVVTVAVRSDGSVESVSFVRSSGVPAIDEAIRRIVHSQANYPPFQPALAREYDVVEIRRTWHFDMAIRLY